MIDDDWEKMPPVDSEHRVLWKLGFGPVKRNDVLCALHDIQQQQLAAGFPVILDVYDICTIVNRLG